MFKSNKLHQYHVQLHHELLENKIIKEEWLSVNAQINVSPLH